MAATELRQSDTSCEHCGLALPRKPVLDAARRSFCCEGCCAVYSVIHELGLERYYELKDSQTVSGRAALSSTKSYAEFDDVSFQARWVTPLDNGWLRVTLYLEGIHCAACVWLLERVDRLTPGLIDLQVDLPRSRATVVWDPELIKLSGVARRLANLGYPAHPARGLAREAVRRREDRALLMRIGVAGAVAGNVMTVAFALYAGMFESLEAEYYTLFRWTSLGLVIPSLLYGGGVFFRGAFNALRARTLHMDLPIAIGLAAGFIHGLVNTVRGTGEIYFDSVATLIFLLLVGRYLQQRQQRVAADSAELLAALSPSSARLITSDGVRDVPLESLLPGMRIELLPGDTIPVDGRVLTGRSQIDLSLLTGESVPIAVGPDDGVHAGTVNLSARLEVEVASTGEQTRVGRLMSLVEQHAARRAPIVQLADRISGLFVAIVLALAAVTLGLWWGTSSEQALDHAIALLIVTCPCALGLATPLAVSAAIGQAARAGILIKGADVLEKLSRRGTVLLDKTGTVTEGRLALVRWSGEEAAQRLVAALEQHSTHPVARAIQRAFPVPLDCGPVDMRETQGGGVSGTVGRHEVVVGTAAFIVDQRIAPKPRFEQLAADAAEEGFSPAYVAVDGEVVALAAFGDPLRDDAGESLDRLRRLGYRPALLSGDHPRVVAAVARRLEIEPTAAHGGVSPEAKLQVVLKAREQGSVVMAGDGVNDAAALAAAPVGIAVEGGAEAALAAADVFMTRRGVAPLADLFEGANRTMSVVRRNLVFSLAYNVVGTALAMSGMLNPLIAAVLMPFSSLTVIFSSYRATTFRRSTRGGE